MVFNWFERQAEESPKPEPTPTPAPTSEPSPAQEPTSVSSEVAVTQPEPTPAPEVNEEEDEALAWAREAYARLKAQQQAATPPAEAIARNAPAPPALFFPREPEPRQSCPQE